MLNVKESNRKCLAHPGRLWNVGSDEISVATQQCSENRVLRGDKIARPDLCSGAMVLESPTKTNV